MLKLCNQSCGRVVLIRSILYWSCCQIPCIFNWWGRDGLWWPALSCHWLSRTRCGQYLLSVKWIIYGILFLHLSASSLACCCPRTFFDKRLDKLPWTSFMSNLLFLQMIISRSVLVSANDYPCGVWGLGLTTCSLYDGPLLSLYLK